MACRNWNNIGMAACGVNRRVCVNAPRVLRGFRVAPTVSPARTLLMEIPDIIVVSTRLGFEMSRAALFV